MEKPARKISIYLNEGDQFQGKPLYLELLEMFRKEGCSGATVLRAVGGFTSLSAVQTTSPLASRKMPLVVEMVESPEKIRAILPRVREMVGVRLVTFHEVTIADDEPAPKE